MIIMIYTDIWYLISDIWYIYICSNHHESLKIAWKSTSGDVDSPFPCSWLGATNPAQKMGVQWIHLEWHDLTGYWCLGLGRWSQNDPTMPRLREVQFRIWLIWIGNIQNCQWIIAIACYCQSFIIQNQSVIIWRSFPAHPEPWARIEAWLRATNRLACGDKKTTVVFSNDWVYGRYIDSWIWL